MPHRSRCSRCGRTIDREFDPVDSWEVIADGETLICEGCITGAEQQAMDEGTWSSLKQRH